MEAMSKHESHKTVPMDGRAAFATSKFSEGKRVELDEVLAALIVEKIITAESAKSIRISKGPSRAEMHPLIASIRPRSTSRVSARWSPRTSPRATAFSRSKSAPAR
jgi:hypothetical protein